MVPEEAQASSRSTIGDCLASLRQLILPLVPIVVPFRGLPSGIPNIKLVKPQKRNYHEDYR